MTAGPASPHTDTAAARVPFRALLWTSLIASGLAAAATEAFSAVVRAAGVHLAVGDPGGSASSVVPVNAGACAISIAMAMVVGTGIAALINWRSSRPARTYVIVTSVLALVSLVAPLTAAATSTGTKLTLVAAHLIAAAIIVPLVGSRLAGTRQDGSR
ncbi:DUF6069 family protein [Actinomadura coerulea]|uniref:DUF6069 family protein n=1 Tax=Actinomadura coerulea TaxID=46159 RepID=UPI0034349367